jgi:hypothetical protein
MQIFQKLQKFSLEYRFLARNFTTSSTRFADNRSLPTTPEMDRTALATAVTPQNVSPLGDNDSLKNSILPSLETFGEALKRYPEIGDFLFRLARARSLERALNTPPAIPGNPLTEVGFIGVEFMLVYPDIQKAAQSIVDFRRLHRNNTDVMSFVNNHIATSREVARQMQMRAPSVFEPFVGLEFFGNLWIINYLFELNINFPIYVQYVIFYLLPAISFLKFFKNISKIITQEIQSPFSDEDDFKRFFY